jgi:Asp-tRNA(Asn)/Glu-tRNA(Gln) amidotransferase A subunit family amidase
VIVHISELARSDGLSPVVSKQTIDPGQGTWASQGTQIRQSARTNSTEAVATAGGNTDMDAKCSAGAGDPTNPAEILDGDIASALVALDTREVTSEALVRKCLTRSAAYDSGTEGLNSIVVANPLAFASLTAQWDAFSVEMLRSAGAVLIGKTNMPPMADGGMQRGLYGRSESPYDRRWPAAAFGSGSSHGSAVATTAEFAMFGMGEETVSSGRSPASNNSLCAYTPPGV